MGFVQERVDATGQKSELKRTCQCEVEAEVGMIWIEE